MAEEKEWRIIIPTTDNSGNQIREDVLSQIAKEMAEWFGGVTVYPAAGCYVSQEAHRLECNPDIVIASSEIEGHVYPEARQTESFMARLALQVGAELGQEDVYEQETTTDYSQWVPGDRMQVLPKSRLDLTLPRVNENEVLGAILPARFHR